MSHGQLFLRRHAAAGRLLSVAQRGVKEEYLIADFLRLFHGSASCDCFQFLLSMAYNAKL
jgi:hypothetical protein